MSSTVSGTIRSLLRHCKRYLLTSHKQTKAYPVGYGQLCLSVGRKLALAMCREMVL